MFRKRQALLLTPFAVVKKGVLVKTNTNPKKYLHLHVYSDIIYNSQDMETAWMPIGGWMDKEKEVYMQWNTCCLVTKSCPTFCNPMDCTCQAPLSMGFSRQEYWRGLSFPPPGDLLDPWIEPMSPVSPALAGRFFTAEPPGKPLNYYYLSRKIKNKWAHTHQNGGFQKWSKLLRVKDLARPDGTWAQVGCL